MSMTNHDALLRFNELCYDKEWRFARSMPSNPHWYTLKKHWGLASEFEEAVLLIREYGYRVKFGGRHYTEFQCDGFFYWTMGASLHETILINRAKIDKNKPHPYDSFAANYDSFFANAASNKEDQELKSLLQNCVSGRVLDVGCGTGLLLDLLAVPENQYVGIDPSAGMLASFKTRHPLHEVVQTYFQSYSGTGFNSIVSLYGSFNYVPPEFFEFIREKLHRSGSYFIMFLDDEYHPVTHSKAGVEIPYYKTSEYNIPSDATVGDFYNYKIVRGRNGR